MGKLDILGRDDFVKNLFNLIENISDNKENCCFALNGNWGCGKSFVLDVLEEKLTPVQSEKTTTDKYFVIRYNCWKFDYYEEPIVAIVAALLDTIGKKINFIEDCKEKREVVGVLKEIAKSITCIAMKVFEKKFDVDFTALYNTLSAISEGTKCGADAYEKAHAYDNHFNLNNQINKLTESIKKLTEMYTVVIIVDELDRCIPEYGIKVLERLHHITESGSNIVSIVSVDIGQLETSIKHLFGFVQPEKYLEKFFSFKVSLDYGTITDKISEKYVEYLSCFDNEILQFDKSIEESFRVLLGDLDIRKQEQLINRAAIAHKLLFKGKKDYLFMYMEILLTVMICEHNDCSSFDDSVVADSAPDQMFTQRNTGKSVMPELSNIIKKYMDIGIISKGTDYPGEPAYYTASERELFVLIAYMWYRLHKNSSKFRLHINGENTYENSVPELKKFAETIRMIN